MNSENPFSKLDERILDASEQLVELTQALIRMPTVNPPGDGYASMCDFLEEFLTPYEFSIKRVRAIGMCVCVHVTLGSVLDPCRWTW